MSECEAIQTLGDLWRCVPHIEVTTLVRVITVAAAGYVIIGGGLIAWMYFRG